jgi:hypothetical protein
MRILDAAEQIQGVLQDGVQDLIEVQAGGQAEAGFTYSLQFRRALADLLK